MKNQGFLAAAAALLLALPATAAAADPLPLGESHGVRLQSSRSGLVFRFSDRAAGVYKSIAGTRVELGCTWLEPNEKLGVSLAGRSTGTVMRVPRKRAPLYTGAGARGADYCTIAPDSRSAVGEPVVAIPLTQTGAIALDEREKAGMLYGVLTFASAIGDRVAPSAYPSPARIAASRFARDAARAGYPVVALAAPTDTPPARAFGYWSDGRRSAAVVALSAAGRRLHIDVGPDGEISTNVLGIMLGSL